DLYVAYKDPSANILTLSKFSKTGNLLWTRKYDNNDAFFGLHATRQTILNNHIYMTGQSANQQFIFKINKADGSLVWSKNYASATPNFFLGEISSYNNQLIISGRVSSNGNLHSMVMKLDIDGNVIAARKYVKKDLSNGYYQILPDGSILMYLTFYDFTPPRKNYPALLKINNDLSVAWSNWYPFLPLNYPLSLLGLANKSVLLTGSHSTGLNNTNSFNYMMRTNDKGALTDCPYLPLPVADSTFNVSVTPMNVTAGNFVFTEMSGIYAPAEQVVTVGQESCNRQILCDSITISGRDTICNIPDSAVYFIKRNSACTSPAVWSVNNTNAQIVSFTDTSATIKFLQPGSVTLSVTIFANCGQVTDTISISVQQSPDLLNLGPDRLLCSISTLTLNAGGGFKIYKWQDGSSDSTYTVHLPGTYHVEAADACGNVLRDTVIVSLAADVPFDLGADLDKCDKDTITLTAPAGFTKYNWADNYNISNRYSQTVRVWPATDTVYSVVAETANGCLVYDTIHITVKTGLPLQLRADTSLCRNDSTIITAPAGFTTYTWSTGEHTQQIIVKNKGLYYVEAVAPGGCSSRDSMEILNVYSLPVVNLGKDTILCQDNIYVFDAGSHANYLWHDGSASRTFTASQVGEYWVKVTDVNSCVNTDTVHILGIAALPNNFLDTAAEFCPYEKVTLMPKGSYSKYRWSTGSISPNIEVNIAARYWLEVTNADGCVSREYINVKQKFCRNTIDFPNAFTPNNDRRNETYKPVVRGVITKYKLTIYNRWGQRVFETTEPSRSWNGTLAGRPQDSGSFVWYCEYQFTGEPVNVAKGVLMLIR
ncbi:MAG: gliding motility-associated C-terminal domain-containing protein, partial [Chitinophagaceae bacterium]